MKLTTRSNQVLRGLIAPGTIAMFIGITVFVGQYVLMPSKVHIERRIINGAGQATRLPSIEKLLSWGPELELTAGQKANFEKLSMKESNALKPINAIIESELRKFDGFVKTQQAHSIDNIQSATNGLSLVSRKKREIEQRFAQHALQLLDSQQRSKALKLWRDNGIRENIVGRSASSYD